MSEQTAIEQIARWLHTSRHAVALTGAGISTPSGIPDFRSETCGLWTDVNALEVASLGGFRRNPQGFFDWVRPLIETITSADPNPAHNALAELEASGNLQGIITQNIDALHTRAGNRCVYEIHGHMRQATCTHCFHQYDGDALTAQVLATGEVPRCDICGGVIKPDVILFGEQLPHAILQRAKQAARDSDLLMVIGSSMEVLPASNLALMAQRTGAKLVIINLGTTSVDDDADLLVRGDAAEILPAVVHYLGTLTT